MWLTGTSLPPALTYNATIYFLFRFLVYAGIIKLEYITHRLPKLTILQLVFIGSQKGRRLCLSCSAETGWDR